MKTALTLLVILTISACGSEPQPTAATVASVDDTFSPCGGDISGIWIVAGVSNVEAYRGECEEAPMLSGYVEFSADSKTFTASLRGSGSHSAGGGNCSFEMLNTGAYLTDGDQLCLHRGGEICEPGIRTVSPEQVTSPYCVTDNEALLIELSALVAPHLKGFAKLIRHP